MLSGYFIIWYAYSFEWQILSQIVAINSLKKNENHNLIVCCDHCFYKYMYDAHKTAIHIIIDLNPHEKQTSKTLTSLMRPNSL